MNEADTRAELIDPKLKACGWGVVTDSKILRERDVCKITAGRIQVGGVRSKALFADYILVYKGIKLAVVEAKNENQEVGQGVQQAKLYAEKLAVATTYATNGKEIYQICMETGAEGLVTDFLSPVELWDKTYPQNTLSKQAENWRDTFAGIPFENKSGTWPARYYQEIAIRNTLQAIAQGKNRILLTLATGTGKTAIAFQIAWTLFQTRWNLSVNEKRKVDNEESIDNGKLKIENEGNNYQSRRPRILFLADRNILADQAFNAFSAFSEDAKIRITPSEIRRTGRVPTNGSIFFTIFQSFMSSSVDNGKPRTEQDNSQLNFGQYPADYFDFIIVDECHRGGANDEGTWRGILDYFSPAVQLGLTATPKRDDNINTYEYFGNPVYIYSLKEGINDGFLTPFKVKRFTTTIDEYVYASDDDVIEGEVERDRTYQERDFNRNIEIEAREEKRVQLFMDAANENDKSIIFCANQDHAALIRNLVNQHKQSKDINYCVRVTADEGKIGEQFLREFQDNDKAIPTILTTSQKLSTGVDARNIRNIVLLRPVKQIIEFKQIIGRGTRLFDGKEFFTIYDFVDAYQRFFDPGWDGEPVAEEPCEVCAETPCICIVEPSQPCSTCGYLPCRCINDPPPLCYKCGQEPCVCNKKIKIKLADGKEREIQYTTATSFLNADGNPISAEEFLHNLFGKLPDFFNSEAELRTLWSNPATRKTVLEKLDEAGFGKTELVALQKLIDAEKSDLFDVLEYVFNSDIKPITREARVVAAESTIYALLNDKEKEFIAFVLSKYVESGVDELALNKLPELLKIKYQSLADAETILGKNKNIRSLFTEFQQYLYLQEAA